MKTQVNTILFDLDGTLLPVNQHEFMNAYMTALAATFAPKGLDPKQLIKTIMGGVSAMVQNNGEKSNADAFWEEAEKLMGEGFRQREEAFLHFYQNEFQSIQNVTSQNEMARKCVDLLKEKGYQLVLATNPLFPEVATLSRIRWAGFKPEEFSLITTYENSSYCKPNPDYFKNILERIGKMPEECLMVGNDAEDDLAAAKVGISLYFVTDNLINEHNEDISRHPQGSFEELYAYIEREL